MQTYDLIAPAKLRVITVHARVVGPDGAPPKSAGTIRVTEPGLFGQVDAGPLSIDSDGRFHMLLCEGVRYSAFAFVGRGADERNSEPVEFNAQEQDAEMLFVLDKSAAEFLALSRKLRGASAVAF